MKKILNFITINKWFKQRVLWLLCALAS